VKELYTRRSDVVERGMGDEIFLVNPDSDETYHLNVTGAALWQLLTDPISLPDAVAVLQDAYPDQDRARIEADVTALFSEFLDHRLVTTLSD